MAFKLTKKKVVTDVQWFDGPTWAGGAGLSVYLHDDGTMRTVETDWHGRTIAEYDGEPREPAPGTPMPKPPPPPRPGNVEAPPPLPPVAQAPPWPPPSSSSPSIAPSLDPSPASEPASRNPRR